MKLLLVAGARPNFVKIAPILRAAADAKLDTVLVHTGQHYGQEMSDSFFHDLGIRAPDHHLAVGSMSLSAQTARIMERFEGVLRSERPDWVVVVGDVNSTLAAALVTAQLRPTIAVRLAHVEAGLRSRDWTMPEEVNRVVTDRLSDLLLTPSLDANDNLLAEGVHAQHIQFVGNVMIDTLYEQLRTVDLAAPPPCLKKSHEPFILATLHRPASVDDQRNLRAILSALAILAQSVRVILPLHPRTLQRCHDFALDSLLKGIIVEQPLPYRQMLYLEDRSSLVITDSGGVQEETTVLGVPCLTVRQSTERPATITHGTNTLAPWPPDVDSLVAAARTTMTSGRLPRGSRAPAGWDGRAASRIIAALATSPASLIGALP